jgi:hypothetical protein
MAKIQMFHKNQQEFVKGIGLPPTSTKTKLFGKISDEISLRPLLLHYFCLQMDLHVPATARIIIE